jgi:glycine cleavage system aminomethyltransferase T
VLRDGVAVGQVTSAAWGAAVASSVGLALVSDRGGGAAAADWVRRGSWETDVAGQRFPLEVTLRAPYDPEGLRLGRTTP